MSRLLEAQTILRDLGLPPAQQNESSGYTLLALAAITESMPWSQAQRRSIGIHDMLGFLKQEFGKVYAENSRETIRKQVLHQFEQARIVDRNPDNPDLATNSPRTHYALSPDALQVLHSFERREFSRAVRDFRSKHKALVDLYSAQRRARFIQVDLPDGIRVALSPGKHNELQAAFIREFPQHFADKVVVIYLGDAENKALHLDTASLDAVGIPITTHDKLPDIILLDSIKRRLFLVEAVTSHGPVTPTRWIELERLLENSSYSRVYVTAFSDWREFRRHIGNIAWETEVWIAENPDHLIHFDGERFLPT